MLLCAVARTCCPVFHNLRSIDYMLDVRYLYPSNIFDGSVWYSIISLCVVIVALYPLLQNCDMDSRALFLMSGNKWQ